MIMIMIKNDNCDYDDDDDDAADDNTENMLMSDDADDNDPYMVSVQHCHVITVPQYWRHSLTSPSISGSPSYCWNRLL